MTIRIILTVTVWCSTGGTRGHRARRPGSARADGKAGAQIPGPWRELRETVARPCS